MRSSIAFILIVQFAAFGQQQTVPSVPKGAYKFEVNSQLVLLGHKNTFCCRIVL